VFIYKKAEFVQLGGDSLSAVKLQKKVKEQFQVDIPLALLYQNNFTVNDLVDFISNPNQRVTSNINWEEEMTLDPTVSTLNIVFLFFS
jgi:hypothetical protein